MSAITMHPKRTVGPFSGFRKMVWKEWRQSIRGATIWVISLVTLLFAATSPILAKYMNELMGTLLDPALAQIMNSQLSAPTWVDAYGQWDKNMTQIVAIIFVLIAGGAISSEVKSGSAAMILTRNVSRSAFVLAKIAVNISTALIVSMAGALITWVLTVILFDTAPAGPLFASAFVWWLAVAFLICVTVLASAWVGNSIGAGGVGIGVYALMNLLGVWAPTRTYSPGGTFALASTFTAGSDATSMLEIAEIWGPIVTTSLCAVIIIYLTCTVFNHREI